ncbi:hypothetical protein KC345_g10094 [Hortaea werneckii]|nr:hypothetical protein KC345_g10094 [Hortaea werneckii]
MVTAGLSGCNTQAAVKEESIPAAEELMNRITEAAEGLHSYEQDSQVWLSTDMMQGGKHVQQTSETSSQAEYMLDPLYMHTASIMKMTGQDERHLEQYYNGTGFYMLTDGHWRSMPDETVQILGRSLQQTADPRERMKRMMSILPYVSVSENGDHYVLSARAAGDQMKDLAAYFRMQYGNGEAAVQQIAEIKSMATVYTVDKKTYLPVQTEDELVSGNQTGSGGMRTETKVTSTISGYNTITRIEVPEEALNAQP